jgi:hypothetical protein
MTLDVVTSVLVLLLVAVTCVAFVVGLLGEFGLLRIARCSECDKVVVRLRATQEFTCLTCRHEHLAHPLRTMRHPVRELVHH